MGAIEKKSPPSRVKEGDLIYGFSSSGFHSNGYSLIRKWLQDNPSKVDEKLIENLLLPTTIYQSLKLLKMLVQTIKAIAILLEDT